MLQAAIVIFLVGSALCGLSQSMGQLIALPRAAGARRGRPDRGHARRRRRHHPAARARQYQGYFGAVFGVSTIIGPLLGGFFVDNLSWRWIFYVNLPIGIVALAVIGGRVPRPTELPPARDGLSRRRIARRVT